jgi:hypothetical protein
MPLVECRKHSQAFLRRVTRVAALNGLYADKALDGRQGGMRATEGGCCRGDRACMSVTQASRARSPTQIAMWFK